MKSKTEEREIRIMEVISVREMDLDRSHSELPVHKCAVSQMVLYGCETWSLTLSEEHRLRVFVKRVLRRIFGPKRAEVTGEWSKLHSEELHNLYSSPDTIRQIKSRRMRCTGHVARMGEERKLYKVLVGKAEGRNLTRFYIRHKMGQKNEIRFKSFVPTKSRSRFLISRTC
jgi:hypothetical protein